MKRLNALATFFVGILLSAIASAVSYSPSVPPDRFDERSRYLEAIELLRSNQFSAYYKAKPQLRTYALYPYLEYTEMRYRIARQSESDILTFAEQHADTPLVKPLMQRWMRKLAEDGNWDTFIRYYDHPDISKTTQLDCYLGYALHRVGRTEEAMASAKDLWLTGHSQPKECDKIFNVWRSAGGITDEIAWQRFALSLKAGNRSLSSYLLRYIGKDDKSFASNYRLVHFKPRSIKRFSAFRSDHIRNREIILHGVKRLARSEPEEAVTTLQRYELMHNFDPEQLEETYAAIGIQLARQLSDTRLLDQLPLDLHNHPDLVEARLKQALKYGNWSEVIVMINLLPQEKQESNRWTYWQARVLAQSTDEADQIRARALFENLSSERSFYGFVSADILDQPYSYQDEPRAVTIDQMLSLEESPGIQRALELLAIGERFQARREWNFSTRNFSSREREVAARVALRWGWYKPAIQSMIEAKAWNHLDFRFPIAYQDSFIDHARRANIPVQWSLAIARQESAFMPDAKSSSGALGVMQLMPATAKWVAGKIGTSYASNTNLTEPELNIRLGTHYLGQMLRRFQNNRILASAAYNAGPNRVEKWLDPSLPFDVWIETIPYAETRNYVQNVLMFSSIYSRRMEDSQPLIYPHERSYFSQPQITLQAPAPTSPNS